MARLWRSKLPAIVTAHFGGLERPAGPATSTHDPSLRERQRVYAKHVIAIVAGLSPGAGGRVIQMSPEGSCEWPRG